MSNNVHFWDKRVKGLDGEVRWRIRKGSVEVHGYFFRGIWIGCGRSFSALSVPKALLTHNMGDCFLFILLHSAMHNVLSMPTHSKHTVHTKHTHFFYEREWISIICILTLDRFIIWSFIVVGVVTDKNGNNNQNQTERVEVTEWKMKYYLCAHTPFSVGVCSTLHLFHSGVSTCVSKNASGFKYFDHYCQSNSFSSLIHWETQEKTQSSLIRIGTKNMRCRF